MEDPALKPQEVPVKEPVNATWYTINAEMRYSNIPQIYMPQSTQYKLKTDQSRVSFVLWNLSSP